MKIPNVSVLEAAKKFATKVHQGQTRRDGVTPYITHPAAVAFGLSLLGWDEHVQAVGWLHDVLEDGSDPQKLADELNFEGFPEEVITAVCVLTKSKNTDYTDYIEKILKNPIARVVKRVDIKHNLSGSPTEKQLAKYETALMMLEGKV